MTVKEINQAVWGEKSKWRERVSYNDFTIKLPDFGSLSNGRQSGRLTDNPIDDSICMFGIVGDSDLLTQNAIKWYQSSPIVKTENHEISQIFYLSATNTEPYRAYSPMEYLHAVLHQLTPTIGIFKESRFHQNFQL